MPVNESNCGRKQPHRHKFKVNDVRKEHVEDSGLIRATVELYVDGTVSVQSAHAVTTTGIKPKNKVNGYVSHGFRSKGAGGKPRAEKCQTNGSILGNGTRSQEGQLVSPAAYEEKPALLDHQMITKSQRKKRKPWHYKRKKAASIQNGIPQATEDWENEIQEVKICNWEKITFGLQPYGPEDVVNFTLRDLSLERTNAPLWQVTSNNYLPALNHRQPIQWIRYKPPIEPGQFSDVED